MLTDPARDPTCVEDIRESHKTTTEIVAPWLGRLGYVVDVRPLRIRPTFEQRRFYSDKGDLYISNPSPGGPFLYERVRIEVKRRLELLFTSRASFPYPTIIVDFAPSWDRADPQPYGYVIVNAPGTHAAVVHGSSSAAWVRTTRYDRRIERWRSYVECPIDRASFVKL